MLEITSFQAKEPVYEIETSTDRMEYLEFKMLNLPSLKIAEDHYQIFFKTDKELLDIYRIVQRLPKAMHYRRILTALIEKSNELPPSIDELEALKKN